MKRIYRIITLIAVFTFITMVLEGCWDLTDISKKLIVTSMGIDLKDDEIWFYLEIANTAAGGTGEGQGIEGSDSFVMYQAHGKTLPEARDNLEEKLDKPLYLSGIRTLVFSERFTNEYMTEYLYRFRTDETYRKQGICVITKDNPGEVISKTHEAKKSLGLYIEEVFETMDKQGKFFPRTTGRIIENLSSKYSGFLLPCIGIQDNLPSIIGYSVVENAKIVGFISMSDVRIHGVYFMKVDHPEIVYTMPYEDLNFTVKTKMTKRRTEPNYTSDGINIKLSFDVSAELLYGNKRTPYNLTEDDLKQMSHILADMIKKEITDAVDQSQNEFGCDYLQFDDVFRIRYPDAAEAMDWDVEFPKINTSVDVSVDFRLEPNMDYGPKKVQ